MMKQKMAVIGLKVDLIDYTVCLLRCGYWIIFKTA